MNIKKSYLILSLLLILFILVGSASANELEGNHTIEASDNPSVELESADESTLEVQNNEESHYVESSEDTTYISANNDDSKLSDTSDEIIVENWNELKYYCSLSDKDYKLKLKENTNFYPEKPSDKNYQIIVNNKVTILGSEGAYIGDTSSNPAQIKFTAIVVPDDKKASLTIDGVVFKNIRLSDQPNGILIQMGGNRNNIIKNCLFTNITMEIGHSTIVYLKKGTSTLQNCSFIKCRTNFGCVSVYDPNSYTSAHMIVRDSYFEDNYASTEPGCINNCGILEVYNTTFYKNRAFWWAGAIHTHYYANTTIYDSNFTDNVAGWNGGALYTYSYLTVYNSIFDGNNCTTNNGGGAIGACKYTSSPHVYIKNSTFIDNENNDWSNGRGGAISIMDDGTLEVIDSTFIENNAKKGSAICAVSDAEYGSPSVIISGNKFINHTRIGDVLDIRVSGTPANVSNNYYLNNSIVFSSLTLETLEIGEETATLKVNSELANPSYYDSDILEKTSYKVYINGIYQKTVDSNIFTLNFGDLDICDVYVIPSVGNSRTNVLTVVSTREYIFVSKSKGDDSNNGLSRDSPVNSLSKAIELAQNYKNILILDGIYSEYDLSIDYDLTIKGEGNATISGNTNKNIFEVNTDNFILKNINIENLTANNFIKQNNGQTIEITKVVFKNNNVNALFDICSSLNVSSSIFVNNTNIISGNIENTDLNYNWWGNTNENRNIAPNSLADNWLFLNISSNVNNLELNQKTTVNFDFNLITKEGIVSNEKYDLPNIDLLITSINGDINRNIINPYDKVTYTQNSTSSGRVSAIFNGIISSLDFAFIKTNPIIDVSVSDIFVGNDLIVDISLPNDATGDLTINIGEYSQTKKINSTNIQFVISNPAANNYTATITYSGDDHYNNKEIIKEISVNKFKSSTVLAVGDIKVHEDVIFTVTVTDNATGNITIIVNGKNETLTLNNSQANFTIHNITRGDYEVEVIYNGDANYMSSSDVILFDVDKLNFTFLIDVKDIVYGNDTIIEITLNDNATGTVTANIDGKTNSSSVIDGKATVILSKIDAGDKIINLLYSGDSTYMKQNYTGSYKVSKADLKFNISVDDLMIGRDANVVITTPFNIDGTFTVSCVNSEIIDVSPFGETIYIIPDLKVGEYEVTVIYNGNNFNTCSESFVFNVFEYDTPQWQNEGYDTANTGKTNYTTNITEGLKWMNNVNSSKNMVIDSEGNIYLIFDNEIYSYDNKGNLRWIYSDNVDGDFSGLAISRDVIIAPKSGDTLHFINQTTGLKYGSSNIYQASSAFAPIVDKNSNIYIMSEYQYESDSYSLVIVPYKLWEYGGSPTVISLGNYKPLTSPTIVDDNLVVVLSENRLRLIDVSSSRTIFTKSGNFNPVRPVVDEGKNIYTIQGNYLVANTVTGAQLWKTLITDGSGSNLYLDNNNLALYSINSKGKLYRYDLFDGTESLISSMKITSGILIDGESRIYFGCDEVFYSINSNGKVLWKINLTDNISNTPIMDKNGVIYVNTVNNLFALTQAPLKETNMEIITHNVSYGDKEIIEVVLNSDATGYVIIEINGETFNETLIGGKATVELNNLDADNYTVNVLYSGSEEYKSSNSNVTFNVLKIKTKLIITTINAFEITGVLKDINNNVISANITYALNNQDKRIMLSDSDGKFTFTASNNCLVNINYIGDNNHYSSDYSITLKNIAPVKKGTNITVDKTFTRTAVDFPAGEKGYMFYFTLKDEAGKVLANKEAKIGVSGKIYTVKTDKNGKAGLMINLANANVYTYAISFLGDSDYKASFAVSKLTVVKKAVTITPAKTSYTFKSAAKSKVITATLKSTNKFIPAGKKVTLTVGGKTYSSTIAKNGKISLNIAKLTKKGTYKVIIKYAGDVTYKAANSKTITVKIS